MKKKGKIYDFSFDKVKNQVIAALKKNQFYGMVADLVSLTGLPSFQIASVLPVIVDECRGQLKVTKTGEILYYFPKGLSSRNPSWVKRILMMLGQALKFLFKCWIMVMLVGYFLLFVCVLLATLIISMALSFTRRDDRDRGRIESNMAGFFLVNRVIDFFLLLWLFSGDPTIRKHKKNRPFYKAVFDFVFGVEENPEEWETRERKTLISFIQNHQGLITLEELMHLTGRDREQAHGLISRFLLEFSGEPLVSDQGTLYYAFPELMKTSSFERKPPDLLPEKPLIPFSHNTASVNRWIVFLNGFNMIFGAYFLFSGWSHGIESTDPLAMLYQVSVALISTLWHADVVWAETMVMIVLGLVPTLYSALFFGIPWVRKYNERQKNRLIQCQNLRRKMITHVMTKPEEIDLRAIHPDSEKNAPAYGPELEKVKEKLLQDFCGSRTIEVVESQGLTYFSIQDLAHEMQDIVHLRQTMANNTASQHEIIFDSGSEKHV